MDNFPEVVLKVGRLFQYVDKVLEKHGVVGTFQAKDIAKYIVRAVEPKELRERVEFDLSTEEGKQYGRDLQMLYNLIVGKFTLWYTLYPDGAAARPAGRGETTRKMEFRGSAPRGLCFNCGRKKKKKHLLITEQYRKAPRCPKSLAIFAPQ